MTALGVLVAGTDPREPFGLSPGWDHFRRGQAVPEEE